MDYEALVKIKGIRTTICLILITVVASIALFIGRMDAVIYTDFMKDVWMFYLGAKLGYKGTEVVLQKKAEKV